MPIFSESDPIVILAAARTPMGAMQGALADASATDLGATAVKAAVERAGVSGEDVERVYMGCVLPAGVTNRRHRQTAHGHTAHLPVGRISGCHSVIQFVENSHGQRCRAGNRCSCNVGDCSTKAIRSSKHRNYFHVRANRPKAGRHVLI